MLVLSTKPERGPVPYSDHAHCKRNASSFGNQIPRRETLSSDGLKHVTPSSHRGLCVQQNDGHPEKRSGIDPVVNKSGWPAEAVSQAVEVSQFWYTGRPKRRAAQRQVNYKDHVDEASDPISDTSLPIPHAQASRKKHAESCKERRQEHRVVTLNCKRDRRLKKSTPAARLPQVNQSGNSSTGDVAETVISETQSDNPSKTKRKRICMHRFSPGSQN